MSNSRIRETHGYIENSQKTHRKTEHHGYSQILTVIRGYGRSRSALSLASVCRFGSASHTISVQIAHKRVQVGRGRSSPCCAVVRASLQPSRLVAIMRHVLPLVPLQAVRPIHPSTAVAQRRWIAKPGHHWVTGQSGGSPRTDCQGATSFRKPSPLLCVPFVPPCKR